jgi:hypothetical protein
VALSTNSGCGFIAARKPELTPPPTLREQRWKASYELSMVFIGFPRGW